MIQVNELRVGNWVLLDTGHTLPQPHSIKPDDIAHIGNHTLPKTIIIEPIPLTPEILKKCGFHRCNNAWVMEGYENKSYSAWDFSIWNIKYTDEYIYHSAEYDVVLTSLHQLQNLYFALTEKELNYKP